MESLYSLPSIIIRILLAYTLIRVAITRVYAYIKFIELHT